MLTNTSHDVIQNWSDPIELYVVIVNPLTTSLDTVSILLNVSD